MGRMADPFSLVGLELSVIAAVVLGGARLIGGYGTLTGTLLGVSLIVLVENSLIVVGIPSTWQFVTIGLINESKRLARRNLDRKNRELKVAV